MPRRHKSHRRQERDRKRAAVYQARMQSHHQSEQDSAVPAESPSHEPRSVSDEVVMVESQEEVIPIESESLPIVPPSTLTSAVSVESGGTPMNSLEVNVNDVVTHTSESEVEVVQAVASFENSFSSQIQQEDMESLQKFVLSEQHLVRNIIKTEVTEILSSRSFRDNRFTHSVLVEIHVLKKNLWESPVSYLTKHLGKSEWKRSSGTLIRLSRIHSK